jgi:hypothetical protein
MHSAQAGFVNSTQSLAMVHSVGQMEVSKVVGAYVAAVVAPSSQFSNLQFKEQRLLSDSPADGTKN